MNYLLSQPANLNIGDAIERLDSFFHDARISGICTDGHTQLLTGIGSLANDKTRLTLTLRSQFGADA
jgi:hypothetical protein